MKRKGIYCGWCGEVIDENGTPWPGDVESCGQRECDREVRGMAQEREDDARERAEMDGYERYR